jgi:hypothetical protein
MVQSFARSNRVRTGALLVAAVLFASGAATVGIDDNALGLSLAMLSAVSLVLAFVHPWRSSSQFRRLIYAALIGFVVFLGVGVALQAALEFAGAPRPAETLLEMVSTVFLLAAAFLCIPALLVGIVGAVVMAVRERHQRRAE